MFIVEKNVLSKNLCVQDKKLTVNNKVLYSTQKHYIGS